jgi:hypothetical protein
MRAAWKPKNGVMEFGSKWALLLESYVFWRPGEEWRK